MASRSGPSGSRLRLQIPHLVFLIVAYPLMVLLAAVRAGNLGRTPGTMAAVTHGLALSFRFAMAVKPFGVLPLMSLVLLLQAPGWLLDNLAEDRSL